MRSVIVVPYDSRWPDLFASEEKLIKNALGENCIAVHHIGSTAVPGLHAKPTIDILSVVENILLVDEFNSAMANLGYVAKGEYGIPLRRYFQKISDVHKHHVHVFEKGNSEIERHLRFRDWMRIHENDRDAYGALKAELALTYPGDIIKYCSGKDAFIANIDYKARIELKHEQ